MSDSTIQDTATKLEFIEYHRPGLKDGDYKITVVQQILTNEEVNARIPETTFTTDRLITVQGPRFSLKPEDVYAVFPPAGSLGEHSNVLPHIALNRSTLPWERTADSGNETLPWLALLLFTEAEAPEPQIITLEDLLGTDKTVAEFPDFTLETGQLGTDNVTIIDVERELLQRVMPTPSDLAYLAHVRQGTDDAGTLVGEELAVVICNRLPLQKGASTVHLVSIEDRYNSNGFDNSDGFDYQDAASDQKIRLVSLKSWRFTCIDPAQSFTGLLKNINTDPSTLQLPLVSDDSANTYLRQGYVPLPHALRQGGQTVSWYHGPLRTGASTADVNSADVNSAGITLPARAPDELLRYNPDNGLFDVSYAAAWELGRLLALQSKQFSVTLYNCKRAFARQVAAQDSAQDSAQGYSYNHLPAQDNARDRDITPPEVIQNWLRRLARLQGVPFNYLVPDERMLPQESIRFFQLDNLWMACLLDGAFSIGRSLPVDLERDARLQQLVELFPQQVAKLTQTKSGFLLRSDVVAGWPGLLVDGYKSVHRNENVADDKLTLLRMDRLSDNVLICLFEGEGEVQTVDIHQKPEALHFGLDAAAEGTFSKELRQVDGKVPGEIIDRIPWYDGDGGAVGYDEDTRVLAISELAGKIREIVYIESQTSKDNNITAAEFALQMIEGVESVRFTTIKVT